MSTRATVMTKKAMIASSHELASFWGANTLLRGGNVVDAAIATSAMLCVVQNNLCGLGGDLFALLKLDGKVKYLNGSGRTGSKATVDFYKNKGYSEIPKRGPLSAITVPGIVHAWGELHSRYATMELSDLLRPAIDVAESGFPITKKYSESIRSSEKLLAAYDGWKSIFSENGKSSEPGFVLQQRDLSNSLRSIAQGGSDEFYNGALSERIVRGIQEQGGLLKTADFETHSSTWDEPLKTNYRGIEVYETAPNTQAATVLLWLNMLERSDLQRLKPNTDELMAVFLETCLKSYQERAKWIADPVFHKLPNNFTSKKYAQEVLSTELITEAVISKRPESKGDTTYFSVIDSDGNCLSMIQSNYMGFGSGIVPAGTGIVMQNRGCYFTLDRTHHNALEPGKRTFHTLCASLGESESGETLFALGCMGGDIQPQVHVQLITDIIDFKMDLQGAIDNSRWVLPGTIYEKLSTLQLETGLLVSSNISSKYALQSENIGTFSSLTGHAQAAMLKNGVLMGAADPRGDGAAVGF